MSDIQFCIAPPFQKLPELGFTDFTLSDFHKNSDDTPHHAPQEVGRLDPEKDHILVGFDLGILHDHHCRFAGL